MDILALPEQPGNSGLVNSLARNVSDGIFPRVSDMLEQSGNSISGLIDSLLQPEHSIEPDVNPVELARRKRLSQQIQQDGGLSR